jgi:hypothetical protein
MKGRGKRKMGYFFLLIGLILYLIHCFYLKPVGYTLVKWPHLAIREKKNVAFKQIAMYLPKTIVTIVGKKGILGINHFFFVAAWYVVNR